MKKILFLVSAVVLLSACSSDAKVEKAAKEQCNKLFVEIAKDPSSVKLSDFRTVYKTDSLCILHLVFTAKNGLGVENSDDMEYLYYVGQDGNQYESYLDLSQRDSIFLNEDQMEVEKANTFYANLDYANAMKHRVICELNENGRVVGDSKADVHIESVVKTGKWELKQYKDEFGQEAGDKYMVLWGTGTFSNSAATNSEMSAVLFVDKNSVSLRLVEYKSSVVKDDDSFDLKLKDKDGIITNFKLYNTSSGYIPFTNSDYFGKRYDDIMKVLNKEGIVYCSGVMHNSYSSSSYTFSLNLDGFKEAYKYIAQ